MYSRYYYVILKQNIFKILLRHLKVRKSAFKRKEKK